MTFFYNIFMYLFSGILHVAKFFNPKIKQGIHGRAVQHVSKPKSQKPVLWMHCASVGEFEQGLPLLQDLQENYYTVVTFFSPSGYTACAKNKCIDAAYYLPLDIKANAINFIETINPQKVVFVKYELWYNYLQILKTKNISTYLISAFFTADAKYFKGVAKPFYKKLFLFFLQIFVQDVGSKNVLASNGIFNCIVAGDTRLDRVRIIAHQTFSDSIIEKFVENKNIIVAGSTWLQDYSHLQKVLLAADKNWKIIIAPHEVNAASIQKVLAVFPKAILYSDALKNSIDLSQQVLIMDNIGMLNKLYRYARVCYIGGGFGVGIHNTLEAVIYKKPLWFGPNYTRFNEAIYFVENNIAIVIQPTTDWESEFKKLENNKNTLQVAIEKYITENVGATKIILENIQ